MLVLVPFGGRPVVGINNSKAGLGLQYIVYACFTFYSHPATLVGVVVLVLVLVYGNRTWYDTVHPTLQHYSTCRGFRPRHHQLRKTSWYHATS